MITALACLLALSVLFIPTYAASLFTNHTL